MMKQQDKKLLVTWRGKKFALDIDLGANLKELGDALQRLTNVKPDTIRLIVPTNEGSKLFYPFSDDHSHLSLKAAHILEGKSIRMMGVPETEVDELLQDSKVNHRIAGFDEEEKRLRSRVSDGQNSLPKLPQGTYIFSDFRTLDLPGIELNPPASEALKLMHRLAADPGIVAIMNKHRWRVGIMTEMAPVGYVGVSPKCILGFNKNQGEEISLRLRTDDLNGFRKYERIKKTLLHELAHMVYSEHDSNFYAFDKQLNEEAATLDWTKTRGYTLSGVRHSLEFEVEGEFTNHNTLSQKLGGQASAFSNARVASVAAAYQRFANASNNDTREEPDSHYSSFTISGDPDCMNIEGKMETSITCNKTLEKSSDALDTPRNEFEPDPDDREGREALESEPGIHSGVNGTVPEPYADHSELTAVPILIPNASEELVPKTLSVPMKGIVAGSEFLGATESSENLSELKSNCLEPDPDDSELRNYNVEYRDVSKPDCYKGCSTKDETQPVLLAKSSCRKPDPDDSQASTTVISEPDRDDNVIEFSKNMSEGHANEPDPDDMELQRIQDPVTALCARLQKAIEMLRSELNPSAAIAVLQTILRILRNAIEHPDELKYRKLRKANPTIQRNIVGHRAATEILHLIGFGEDVVVDGMGNGETYLILKRNDPGLLWLAKTSIESSIGG